MKVTTKITYNAAKLAKAMPKMIENYIQGSGESTIEASRKRIDTINYISHDNSHKKMPKLRPSDITFSEMGGFNPIKPDLYTYSPTIAGKDELDEETAIIDIAFDDEVNND